MFKNVSKSNQKLTNALLIFYIWVLLLVGAGTAYASTNHNLAEVAQLATTKSNESFTQLYFVNPGQLPTFAAPGKKQTVKFRIQNVASQSQTYQYQVVVVSNGGKVTKSGSVTIKANEGTTISFSFATTQPGEQVTSTVSLKNPAEYLLLRSHS